MGTGQSPLLIGVVCSSDLARTEYRSAHLPDGGPSRLADTPEYEIPAVLDLRGYANHQASWLSQEEVDESSARQMRPFPVRQLDPFLRSCLAFRGQARPLGPKPVVAGFRKLVERVAALYAEDADAD